MDEQQRRLAEELLFSGKKKPSFAKMLYFGVLDTTKIFPYPQPTPTEKAETETLIQQLETFMDQQLDPVAIDRNSEIPAHVLQGLGKMGILGMTIGKENGGLGSSQYTYCRVEEAIARRCGSTALFVNAHQSVGLKALLLFGTEKQKERWLPPLARGEQYAAFSLTEPNAGSDASGIQTRAVYIPEKRCYRINGRKQWTTNGSMAHILTVMAKMEVDTPQGKQDKITAFLVTPDMPGFKVLVASSEKVGMRGTLTSNLEFVDLDVPEENILGPIGGGLRVCLTVLDFGRTTFGATCTGSAKTAIEKAIKHAKERYQFNRPLASFPLVKKKIAYMSALLYAMEATTYLTAGLVDGEVEDFMLEAAMLKVFNSDSQWAILYEAMQIFGGRSFFTDIPLERMMRDARLNMIGEGANEVLRAFIGLVGMRDVGMQMKEGLEACKHPFSHFSGVTRFIRQLIHRIDVPEIPVESSLIQAETKQLAKAIRRFGISIIRVLSRYREEIVEKQLTLDRIANAAMAIYTSMAVLSRLDSDLKRVNGNAELLGNDVAIAKFYLHHAHTIIDNQLGSLFSPLDTSIENLSDLITGVKKP